MDEPQTAQLTNIEIAKGWALDVACLFDKASPGFTAGYLRSGHRRRQIIHAAFAAMPSVARAVGQAKPVGAVEIPSLDELDLLLRGREEVVIARHFGACPPGFLTALAKTGTQPELPPFYADLIAIMADRQDRTIARALAHLDRIDQERIEIVRILPDAWRLPGLIVKLRSLQDARKFLRSIELIRQWCPAASHGAIEAGIQRLSREGSVAKFIAGWVHRAAFPEGPIRSSDTIEQIREGTELERMGRRMRNCLRDQIEGILSNTSCFYLVRDLAEPVIVHINRPSRQSDWVLEDVYVRNNLPVTTSLRRATEAILIEHGFNPQPGRDATSNDIRAIQDYLWSAQYDREAA